MNGIFEKIQRDLNITIANSSKPVVLFNEGRNLLFCNKSFLNRFNFSEKYSPVGRIPDFIFMSKNDRDIPFSEIPMDSLMEDDIIFFVDKTFFPEEEVFVTAREK